MQSDVIPESPAGPRAADGHLQVIRRRIRDWGLRRAIHWQIMHALTRLIGLHIHYVKIGADRLDLRDRTPPEVPPGYVTRLACKADFEPYVGKVEGLDREFFDRAFLHDDECTLTLYGDELVSFCFVSRDRARVSDQLEVIVPKGFRYVYKSWTHPDHRRMKLSKMGGYVRNFQAKRAWAERSISFVETHNYPSLLHGERHPSERSIPMGYVGWITIAGRQIPFNSRKPRQLGFEIVRKGDRRRRQWT